MRALGRLNTLEGMPRPNNSNSITMLLEEPLAGELAGVVPGETLDEITRVTAEVEAVLRAAWGHSRDRIALEEMINSAQWMAYAARKVRATAKIRAALAGDEDRREAATAGVQSLRELERALVPLQAEFVRLWRRCARESEIGQHLGALAALRKRFELAQAWLGTIADGERDDLDIEAYLASTPRYEILGQHFWRLMREVNDSL